MSQTMALHQLTCICRRALSAYGMECLLEELRKGLLLLLRKLGPATCWNSPHLIEDNSARTEWFPCSNIWSVVEARRISVHTSGPLFPARTIIDLEFLSNSKSYAFIINALQKELGEREACTIVRFYLWITLLSSMSSLIQCSSDCAYKRVKIITVTELNKAYLC